ncbi:NlpC-P60 family protein, partial [bacterium M00.F.Ca.ET.229.01.1.1]
AARLGNADAPILDRAQIEAQNARMRAQDSHLQDIAALPAQLDAATVRASITALSRWPARALYSDKGQPIAPALRSAIEANLGLDAIPAEVAPAYGLVVKRAALRT